MTLVTSDTESGPFPRAKCLRGCEFVEYQEEQRSIPPKSSDNGNSGSGQWSVQVVLP